MFNIKNIVSKITDRGRNSLQSDDYTEQGAEGFLCPKCMTAFITPEELHNHYETLHKEDFNNIVSNSSFDSEEEDRILPKTDSNDQFNEIFGIKDINVLKEKLIDSIKVNNQIKSEKAHLEQVAANLAHTNVSLKAASDEAVDNQVAISERLKIVEAQLAHRESIDDASVLRQELVQVQRYMDELTREKEREVEELKEKLNQLLEKEPNFPNENKEWEEKFLELTKENETQLQKLQEELIEKKNEIKHLSESLENEKRNNAESIYSNAKVKTLNEILEHENLEMKEKISLFQKMIDEQNLKIDNLKKFEQDHDKLTKKLESCKIELNQTKEVLDQEVLKHQSAAKAINLSKNKINAISECIKLKFTAANEEQKIEKDLIINQIDDLLKIISPDIENIEDEIQKQIINLQKELRQSQIKIDEIEKDKCELKKSIEKKNIELLTIQKELTESKDKINVHEKQHNESINENITLKTKLETSMIEKNNQITELNSKISELSKIKSENETTKANMIEISNKYNELFRETGKNKENFHKEIEKYKKLEENLNNENGHLKDEVNKMQNQVSEFQELLKNSNNNLIISQNKIKEIEESLNSLNNKNKNLLDKLSCKVNEFDELETQCNELKENLNSMSKTSSELNQTLEETKSKNVQLNQEIDKLKTQVQDLTVAKTSLDTNIFQLEKSMAELESEKKDAEEIHIKLIENFQDTINNCKKEIFDLEETKKIIIQENAELKTEISSFKGKFEIDKKQFERQEKALNEKIKKLETEILDFIGKLKNEEYNKLKLNENIEEIKKDFEFNIDQKNKEIESLRNSLDEITGNKLELQAQLETCQSEQKTLLERYYVSSFDNEKLHEVISDLRRKLEDSQSALHELGRENQTLQLELEKLFGRKWTEDSDVANCTLCRKEFSLINRRHHCRNCGQIFCNDCSSKLAPVSNNKKPVRVCDSCYNELSAK